MANRRFVSIVACQGGLRGSTQWQKSQGTVRGSDQGFGETYGNAPSDPQTEDPRTGLKQLEIVDETNL
jgi:hypothetical protein